MSIGNLSVGSYKAMGAGTSANVKSSQGALLGIYATVAGSVSLYDDTATGTSVPIGTALPLVAGWNPIPVAFANGLFVALTTSGGTVVFA